MLNLMKCSVSEFVKNQNESKKLFTAGPASLTVENISGLMPCFGRGDQGYTDLESEVLDLILRLSGQQQIVRMQGSGSLAMEVMCRNFLFGRVLVLRTGYYSDRLRDMALSCIHFPGQVTAVDYVDENDLSDVYGDYDWFCACPVETSVGLKTPISKLRAAADKLNSKLMLDATASIGLEEDHELADVASFSSCKGLFGLTGACFVTYNLDPHVEVDSFYLSLESHKNKKMTGPYHSIASLLGILRRHQSFKQAVITNKHVFSKKYSEYLTLPSERQPLLCTHIAKVIIPKSDLVILYTPRNNAGGSVVCHLGEVHLGEEARGQIIETLDIKP